jgi:hypothetical protein
MGRMATQLMQQGFCCIDCLLNPNGCVFCGRTGPILGNRQKGTVQTLSGNRVPAYREVTAMDRKGPLWTTIVGNAAGPEAGRPASTPRARESFQPCD